MIAEESSRGIDGNQLLGGVKHQLLVSMCEVKFRECCTQGQFAEQVSHGVDISVCHQLLRQLGTPDEGSFICEGVN